MPGRQGGPFGRLRRVFRRLRVFPLPPQLQNARSRGSEDGSEGAVVVLRPAEQWGSVIDCLVASGTDRPHEARRRQPQAEDPFEPAWAIFTPKCSRSERISRQRRFINRVWGNLESRSFNETSGVASGEGWRQHVFVYLWRPQFRQRNCDIDEEQPRLVNGLVGTAHPGVQTHPATE